MMRIAALCLFLGVALTSCSTEVHPIVDSGRAYTVYGLLDARADTQSVRVFAIEGTLDLVRPASLGATVTTMELGTGTRHPWQEDIVQYDNGRYGHVYWSGFRGAFGRTYRMELIRPDGVTSSLEVTMPPESVPERLLPNLGIGFAEQPVLWRDAPRLHDIDVTYVTNFGDFDFPYPLDQDPQSDGVVLVIRLSQDVRGIYREVIRAGRRASDLRLLEVQQRVLVSDKAWEPPGGKYDRDVLIEPGVFSNVQNGFGFVGAGYDAVLAFDPPDSVKIAAGLFVGDDG